MFLALPFAKLTTLPIVDGVFYAELNEFFQRELAEEGYSGVEVRVTPTVTDISKHHSRCEAGKTVLNILQSFGLPTLRRFLASKAVAFVSSHHSSKNASN